MSMDDGSVYAAAQIYVDGTTLLEGGLRMVQDDWLLGIGNTSRPSFRLLDRLDTTSFVLKALDSYRIHSILGNSHTRILHS